MTDRPGYDRRYPIDPPDQPAVRLGKLCVRGTRLTVGDVLGILAPGRSEAGLLLDFPQLTHEDVLTCLGFAAEREKRLITSAAV